MTRPTFERLVTLSPAFDRRHPSPSKNYGIHGVELRMVLKGPGGAVQFLVFTGWMLPHVQEELDARSRDHRHCHPDPADLGYHSPTPRYTDQPSMDCDLLASGHCYYDGSGLNAEPVYQILVEKGSEGVWAELERYYHAVFDEDDSSDDPLTQKDRLPRGAEGGGEKEWS